MSAPRRMSTFIGRDDSLREVRDLLGTARLVTITGTGGIGKTRLALELLHRVGRAFPDGVAVVELAHLEDGREVAPALATALAAPDQSNRSPVDRIVRHLAGRRMLILVDNCEHVLAEVGTLLAELMEEVDGVSFLATSREPLAIPGERLFPLAPLALPPRERRDDPVAVDGSEAVRLLVDRARSFDPRFEVTDANRDAVIRLCELLDGLPLAIELAAARLRTISVDQVLAKLGERFTLLTGGARVALPRHRTLWALVDWSHELCSEDERLLWARLSVFPGSFDLDAVEAVCADALLPRGLVLDVLDRLIAKSIVLAEPGGATMRYRMLVTMREYGARRLDERGERAPVRRRHRDHYLATAAGLVRDWSGPGQAQCLGSLRRDHANLVAALEWSVSTPGEEQQAARFVALLRYHWVTGHHLSDGRRWLDRVLALDHGLTSDRGDALWVAAWVCLLHGDRPEAGRRLTECRTIAVALDDEVLGAHADHWTGLMHYFDHDSKTAIPFFEAAVAVQERVGDLAATQIALRQLALAQTFGGLPELALETCARVVALSEQSGERWSRAYSLWVTGICHWHLGDLGAAMAAARCALELQRDFQDGICIALTLDLVACVTADAGDFARAATVDGAAHAVWTELGTTIQAIGSGLVEDGQRMRLKVDEALGSTEADRLRRAQAGLTRMGAVELALGQGRASGKDRRGPGPLTAREVEVALLVADGLSNRGIADRLVISTRTVDGHMERILAKLGCSSRTQVASWATLHGPAS